mgnify:CR=1 FL=1
MDTDDKRHFESQLNELYDQLRRAKAPQARVDALLALQHALENALTAQDEQLALLEEAEQLAHQHALSDTLPHIKYAIARWHYHQSDFARTLVHAREAYDELPEDALDMRFRTMNLIANIYNLNGNFVESLALFRRFLEQNQRLQAHYNGRLRVNIGVVYMRMKRWQEALDETLEGIRAMHTFDVPDKHKHLINAYENASFYAYQLGDGQCALEMAQAGIAYTEVQGLPVTNSAMMMLGRAHQALGNLDEAERILHEAMHLTDGMKGDFWYGYIKGALGALYTEMEQNTAAERFLKEALEHFDKVDTPDEIANAHHALYKFYSTHRQVDRALYHHEQYHALITRFMRDQTDAMLKMSTVVHEVETAKLLHKMEEARAQALQRELDARQRNERRALELALEREKVRLLSEFVSHTSHDLRTPLAVIKTNAYLARRVNEPQRQAGFLDNIDAQVSHLNMLISTMQTMVKLDTEVAYEAHPLQLPPLLDAILRNAQDSIAQRQHHVTLDLPDDLTELHGNREYLELALTALLSNAILYTPDGGKITLRAQTTPQGQVCISVQDNGIGIPPEHLPYVFERFYKVDTARRKNDSGLGFGLTMAKRIIEAHGGTIEAESTPDVGSVFRVYLPSMPA